MHFRRCGLSPLQVELLTLDRYVAVPESLEQPIAALR